MSELPPHWNADAQRWRDESDHDSRPTVTAPPPPIPPQGGPDPRVLRTVAVAFLVLGVLTALAVWRLAGGASDNAGPPDCARLAQSPVRGSAGTEASPDTAPPSRVCADEQGFRVAVPEGWKRSSVTANATFQIDYDDPTGDRFLRVFDVSGSSPEDSIDALEGQSDVSSLTGRACVDDGEGDEQCVLEYTVPGGEMTWFVVAHHFRAVDGAVYGVATYQVATAEDRAYAREVAQRAARHFCPPKRTCESA
ncbi:hypothetical protein [Streptomyces sp. NPDC057702]|uniref:hypothetical protein n=1 Tax=unclassified Streptomyces TaxID=2593676 RepID=UPI0036C1DC55